jgi:DNA mismatch endonuclease (patch repair protein)
MIVRRLVHAMGYRYRLHRKDLPGKPDLVFGPRRKAIFVNGCFWHGHHCVRGARQPKANAEYWRAKIARNVERDAANEIALKAAGWSLGYASSWIRLTEVERAGLPLPLPALKPPEVPFRSGTVG